MIHNPTAHDKHTHNENVFSSGTKTMAVLLRIIINTVSTIDSNNNTYVDGDN